MSEDSNRDYDSGTWIAETGASTGDLRENDSRDAGFTDEVDRVFRSHFQRVNRLADRGYEQARPAYQLGWSAARDDKFGGRAFNEVEKDLENGWLNVRTGAGDWASVRELAQAAFQDARSQGRIASPAAGSLIGTTPSHERPPFRDPVANNTDPTSPESPEQTLDYQRDAGDTAHEPPNAAP